MGRNVKVLVEVAHIYQDEWFGKDQEESFRVFESLRNDLGSDVGVCVLVDDLNIQERLWDEKYLMGKLSGEQVDFVYREKSLGSLADRLIDRIPNVRVEKFSKSNKLVWVYDDGVNRFGLREKVEGAGTRDYCVLLSLCWSLCKLGLVEYDVDGIMMGEVLVGYRVLTVLPDRFRGVESNVMVLLTSMFGDSLLDRMDYMYF